MTCVVGAAVLYNQSVAEFEAWILSWLLRITEITAFNYLFHKWLRKILLSSLILIKTIIFGFSSLKGHFHTWIGLDRCGKQSLSCWSSNKIQ